MHYDPDEPEVGVYCSRLLTRCSHRNLATRRTKSTRSACERQAVFQSFLNPRYICDRRRKRTFRQQACEVLGMIKKELVRTPLFSVYTAFAHAHTFLLKKWQVLILNSDMHIESVFLYACRYRNCRKFIIRNLSRKCIWSALYVDKIVYYGCETSEITSI